MISTISEEQNGRWLDRFNRWLGECWQNFGITILIAVFVFILAFIFLRWLLPPQ